MIRGFKVEYITIISLLGIIAYQGYVLHIQRKQFDILEQKLLDRIMCRDFAQFVQGEIAHKQVDRELTAEEIAEMHRERGIPV